MASGRMGFYSSQLMQHTDFTFILPNDVNMMFVKHREYYERPAKSLILLHGLMGTDTDWLYSGTAWNMAVQYNLSIFMPAGGNSFFLNKGYRGADYTNFAGQEFPEYIRKVFGYCGRREDTIIGGLSMGGFGALHITLAYPETFSSCIALSSAIATYEVAETGKRKGGFMPDEMVRDIFGDHTKLLESDANPEFQFRKCREAGKEIPEIYLAVGTEDPQYEPNQRFRSFLESEHADFLYEEGPGTHNWDFWNHYIDRGLSWALTKSI